MTSPITTARAIIIPAAKNWDSTIIFCHGLGDTGQGFSFLAQNWRRRNLYPNTAFIFPHAPTIPITCNFNQRMPGWYDIFEFNNINGRHDEPGMLSSLQIINGIITEQINAGISSKRVILGGFSQGGVMSLLTGLTSEISLGGIIALSSYCPLHTKFANMISDTNRKTPIFMGHGTDDQTVRFDWGVKTREILEKAKCVVEWHQYEGLEHSVDMTEMDDMEKFITKRLEATASSSSSGSSGNKGTSSNDVSGNL